MGAWCGDCTRRWRVEVPSLNVVLQFKRDEERGDKIGMVGV